MNKENKLVGNTLCILCGREGKELKTIHYTVISSLKLDWNSIWFAILLIQYQHHVSFNMNK